MWKGKWRLLVCLVFYIKFIPMFRYRGSTFCLCLKLINLNSIRITSWWETWLYYECDMPLDAFGDQCPLSHSLYFDPSLSLPLFLSLLHTHAHSSPFNNACECVLPQTERRVIDFFPVSKTVLDSALILRLFHSSFFQTGSLSFPCCLSYFKYLSFFFTIINSHLYLLTCLLSFFAWISQKCNVIFPIF